MKTAKLAALITASVFFVNWIFGMLGQTVTQLFVAVPTVSAVTGTVGEKMLAWIGGIIPLGDLVGLGFLATFISAMVALVVGDYLVTGLKLPTIKGKSGKLVSTILWGAVPIYAILVGFVAPSVMTIIGVSIHTFVVAWIAVYAAGILKWQI